MSGSGEKVTVVAAVIFRQDRVLIGQRVKGQWNEDKWEFPGGKVEAGESPREALVRELREELAIEAAIGAEMDRYDYEYPGRSPIHLIFFRVEQFEGEPQNLAFQDVRWEAAGRLAEYDFLEGDAGFVSRLARGAV